MSRRAIWPILVTVELVLVTVFTTGRCREPSCSEDAQVRLRQPVALVVADEGRRLFVANRRAGTVSLIDVARARVIAETAVGKRLADLADGGEDRLLLIDETAGELIVLKHDQDSLTVSARLWVGDTPVSICKLTPSRAAVACLWPRQLVMIDFSLPAKPRVSKTISLPFAPRRQLALSGGAKAVVSDAFGGRLAVVDTESGVIESVRSVPGHNIGGLVLTADGTQLLLSQQTLAEETPTRADDIRWGNVITNGMRSLSLDDLMKPDNDLLGHGHLHPLGEFGHGAADPAGVSVIGDKIVVALAGTGEVAFGPKLRSDWPRLRVGRRPTALASVGSRIFVADTHGDSVSVIDSDKVEKVAEVSLGPAPELTPAQRGELMFFDARLSIEGWMSCHSCHSDGHANGLRSDTLGDGSYGAPKRVPTLLGVADTAPWAWNGSMARLEEQVRQSIQTTMRGSRPTERQVADLVAYLRTLTPPPRGAETDGARRGEAVFQAHGCARCHAPPTYSTPRTYEVDLEDEMGTRAFNPPSLRGVSHGIAFFHDGRATSLKEVFTRFHHQVPANLAPNDVDDLLAFLRTL